jgi:hypothetical protein
MPGHRGWQEGRRGLVAQRGLARGDDIIQDIPVLRLERRHRGHHRFDNAGAYRALGPKAAFAPEHPGTDRTSAALFVGSTSG